MLPRKSSACCHASKEYDHNRITLTLMCISQSMIKRSMNKIIDLFFQQYNVIYASNFLRLIKLNRQTIVVDSPNINIDRDLHVTIGV